MSLPCVGAHRIHPRGVGGRIQVEICTLNRFSIVTLTAELCKTVGAQADAGERLRTAFHQERCTISINPRGRSASEHRSEVFNIGTTRGGKRLENMLATLPTDRSPLQRCVHHGSTTPLLPPPPPNKILSSSLHFEDTRSTE